MDMRKLVIIIIALMLISLPLNSCIVEVQSADSFSKPNGTKKNILHSPESSTSDVTETETEFTDDTTEPEPDTAQIAETDFVLDIDPFFDRYLEINAEVAGYIRIEGTNIDYPVLFTGNNDYYLNHDIYGNESKYGSIFIDCYNHGALLDRNVIIHGHNFDDGLFFGDLVKYKDENFFNSHLTVEFNNLYRKMKWRVFSVYTILAEEYSMKIQFKSDDEFIDFANEIKNKSIIKTDYEPQGDDYLLTLHTCSNDYRNTHTIVHAYLER